MLRHEPMASELLKGKVCVVTGASSGIGKETALGLAKLGAALILVCRDAGRGAAAAGEIRRRTRGAAVEVVLGDLSSQAAVRRIADEIKARHERLHVLVNNAGLITTGTARQVTVDGLELQLAVNHLAPFLLTHLLLDRLRAGAAARIVVVASQVESRGKIDFDDLQSARGDYDPMRAYCQSKLANVLFTYELARRLGGSKVTANCLHPGVIATNLLSDYLGRPRAMGFISQLSHPGPEKGAKTSILLASDPSLEGVSGKYFREEREAQSSPGSRDPAVARRLWTVSCELSGLPVDQAPDHAAEA
jgi:NAD(P)-dependent dehydrogenase (short-subunit alcohol dehydrogenase family)